MTENFFEERSENSKVKATIVEKYFKAWANIMMPRDVSAPASLSISSSGVAPTRKRRADCSTGVFGTSGLRRWRVLPSRRGGQQSFQTSPDRPSTRVIGLCGRGAKHNPTLF
jgi:hypothetical protein